MPREKTVIDRYATYYTSRMTIEEYIEFKKNRNEPIEPKEEKELIYIPSDHNYQRAYNFLFGEKDK